MALQDILAEDLRDQTIENIRTVISTEINKRINSGKDNYTTGEIVFNIQHPSDNQERVSYIRSQWEDAFASIASDLEDNGFSVSSTSTEYRLRVTVSWLPISEDDEGGGEPQPLPRITSLVLFENRNQFSTIDLPSLNSEGMQLSISIVSSFSTYPGMSSWVPLDPYVITAEDITQFTDEQYTVTRYWSFVANKMVSVLSQADILESGYSFEVESVSDDFGNLVGVRINSPGELQEYFYDESVSTSDNEYAIAIRILQPNQGYEDDFQNGGAWIKLLSSVVS
jgi:hypothetical protein